MSKYVNLFVWGVLSNVVGFDVVHHWQAWAIILVGLWMVHWTRHDMQAQVETP